jgi:primosomal protein N' (replication factor Y)
VTLNAAQQQAVATVQAALGRFAAFLLEGVTGSGKTEVYFRILEQALAAGRQALLLVPEIGLTPQLVGRVQAHFAVSLAVLHSGLNDRERLDAWLAARSGRARIVIGTRSAVFVPLAEPGIIIIDEEHDSSFKQMDGFRYHARDIAVIRARQDGVPIVLGSATPSLESLHNVDEGRYTVLHLPHRVGTAQTPAIRLLDVRHLAFDDGLSAQLVEAMRGHLDNDSQVLLFLNRRGYAPTLLCHDCGWLARCERCDAHLIYHQQRRLLRCHHCDAQRPVDPTCPACGSSELLPVGHGTERIEEALQSRFPDTDIVRIDRDSTRGKGRLQDLLARVGDGRRQILIGTQMLAKGHHLPNVTLVAIVSADQGLFSIDFRASERLGQTVIQVAGRAGRADKAGEVLIQTHHPEHPLLQLLIRHDYPHYARHLLDERRAIPLPPYVHMAIVRAEAVGREQPQQFLEALERQATAWQIPGVDVLGPMPAIMERRAGRYRALLVIQAGERKPLHRLLTQLVQHIDTLPRSRHVRWSLDVDPVDMY